MGSPIVSLAPRNRLPPIVEGLEEMAMQEDIRELEITSRERKQRALKHSWYHYEYTNQNCGSLEIYIPS
jgi:hypothetical protein